MELSLVVPVYNEEESLPKFLAAVRTVLAGVTQDYEIIFTADPSSDRTEEIIKAENAKDGRIKMLRFSRRFGQAAAIWAGLEHSSGDAVIVIDCDMQDPPELIKQMYDIWKQGKYKVVIPQRKSRAGESVLKKIVAYCGYWFINKIAQIEIPRNASDFRLLDRAVVNELVKLREAHSFLRGLTAVVGFETYLLPFNRAARADGKSKYKPVIGTLQISFHGIFAFSGLMLRFAGILGFAVVFISTAAVVAAAAAKFLHIWDFPLLAAGVVYLLVLLSGFNFIALGILGAYTGRIYDEVKMRPRYITQNSIGFKK